MNRERITYCSGNVWNLGFLEVWNSKYRIGIDICCFGSSRSWIFAIRTRVRSNEPRTSNIMFWKCLEFWILGILFWIFEILDFRDKNMRSINREWVILCSGNVWNLGFFGMLFWIFEILDFRNLGTANVEQISWQER